MQDQEHHLINIFPGHRSYYSHAVGYFFLPCTHLGIREGDTLGLDGGPAGHSRGNVPPSSSSFSSPAGGEVRAPFLQGHLPARELGPLSGGGLLRHSAIPHAVGGIRRPRWARGIGHGEGRHPVGHLGGVTAHRHGDSNSREARGGDWM